MRVPLSIAAMTLGMALSACAGGGSAPTPTPTAPNASPSSAAATASAAPIALRTATPTAASGIDGIVLAGPTCPVERADSPCAERPVQMRLTITCCRGSSLTFSSQLDGRFRLDLPPGEYVIERACLPQNCDPFPTLKPVDVSVVDGQYTQITLHADTGIR